MKWFFLLLFVEFIQFKSCKAQDLGLLLAKSETTENHLEYWDSIGKYYDRGEYSGVALQVIFSVVQFNASTKKVKVQGITSAGFNRQNHDTLGLCCVQYFLATPVGQKLTKLRLLGVSNDHSLNKGEKEGAFNFEVEISKDDRLYFSSYSGSGLQEFRIGEVCYNHFP